MSKGLGATQRAVLDLAQAAGVEGVTVSEVAERLELGRRFVRDVFWSLHDRRLVSLLHEGGILRLRSLAGHRAWSSQRLDAMTLAEIEDWRQRHQPRVGEPGWCQRCSRNVAPCDL